MDSAQASLFSQQLQGKKIGGWVIEGEFGHGKSAVVLRGINGEDEAAVKVFHPELVERFGKFIQLERINRERSLIGKNHPNLIQILGGGECDEEGYLYVVMNALHQKNLKDVLHEVPPENIPNIISQIASAARFLEDLSLAHRDIKPENIAISSDLSTATLLDLGVLRPVGLSDITDADHRLFIGTLQYSSPEYLIRKEQDSSSGWRALTFYQIGAVLHDLLMKRPLFLDKSEPFATLVHAIDNETPEITHSNTKYVRLAKHCLCKNPETRLQLVNWTDFSVENESQEIDVASAKDRIKKRQMFHTEASNQELGQGLTTSQDLRAELTDVCNQFAARTSTVLNDLQIFPLKRTIEDVDAETKKCYVLLIFDVDEDKGLPFRLAIKFEMSLIDENSGNHIYQASSSAAVLRTEITDDDLTETTPFITAELQEILDSKLLEETLLIYLEKIYSIIEEGCSSNGPNITISRDK